LSFIMLRLKKSADFFPYLSYSSPVKSGVNPFVSIAVDFFLFSSISTKSEFLLKLT